MGGAFGADGVDALDSGSGESTASPSPMARHRVPVSSDRHFG